MSNQLIIAAAGSGKTTFLVEQALAIKDHRVLITTYTQANEAEIRRKIIELNKCIPENITIQTWFSLVMQHGMRPYQSYLYDKRINGLLLVNSQSAVRYKNKYGRNVCWPEAEVSKHYFSPAGAVYSDKLSKFAVRCNSLSKGAVINRLSRVYPSIFIDEVQDLAGYDLEIIKLLFKSSSNVTLVGDPRQVTYLTHNERKYDKYTYGKIADFVKTECKKLNCTIDDKSLNKSYRNNLPMCKLSSSLYPSHLECQPGQSKTSTHDGVFLIKESQKEEYLRKYNPMQLRLKRSSAGPNKEYPVQNFGESKGISYDRVLIYPTADMGKWIKNHSYHLKDKTRAQLYVALTRARFSVGIVGDWSKSHPQELEIWDGS